MSTENTKVANTTKETIKNLLKEDRPVASIVAAAKEMEAKELEARKIKEVRNTLNAFDNIIQARVNSLRNARAAAKNHEKYLAAAIEAKAKYEETGDIRYYDQL